MFLKECWKKLCIYVLIWCNEETSYVVIQARKRKYTLCGINLYLLKQITGISYIPPTQTKNFIRLEMLRFLSKKNTTMQLKLLITQLIFKRIPKEELFCVFFEVFYATVCYKIYYALPLVLLKQSNRTSKRISMIFQWKQ